MTKPFQLPAFRALALSAVVLTAPLAAQASLTLNIPTNALQANAVQAFSEDALGAFELVGIQVKPLGNATAVAQTNGAFNLPVTSISLQLVKISGGAAIGSALEFTRVNEDTLQKKRLTLSNFRIDFNTKKVLADAEPAGQASRAKTPIFDFNEQTALALKYRFPLSITAKQVLDKLFLTPEAKAVFMTGLELPDFVEEVLNVLDFGTITVDVAVKPRSKPVSTRPYVPAP
ncbi:MAG: hypothetical protein I8H76_05855 [Burkholderiales bacterium]|nr:hypothetical protein [Burkholderiales bacterium]MBH2015883.1 hypothetical protein [Burkholderiales bacterium]